MTYIIVILLSIINILFEVYTNKKGNIIVKYNLHKYFYTVIAINIAVFFLLALSIILNNYLTIGMPILDIIINGIYAVTFLLLVLQHEKYRIDNKVLGPNNYISIMIILFVISLIIGDRGDKLDVSGLLILPTLISMVLLVISKYKNNIKINFFKEKKEDNKKVNYNKKININNMFYLAIITTLLLLFMTENSLISYVAYGTAALIILLYIFKRLKKIKTEQTKLSKSIKDNSKIGKEYIFDFQKDIIITRTIIKYLIIGLIALITQKLITATYVILCIQLLVIILNIGLQNKIKLNKLYDSLNKKFISKEYKKVESTLLDDISINDRLLNIKYDKIIYIKDKDIYLSEELLYNIKKEDLNKIDLYINTINYNDYIFVVEEIFK